MNRIPHPWARPASAPGQAGFTGRFIQDIAAAATVAADQHWPAPTATRLRPGAMAAPRLRPHTIQLCIHCRHNPAGFWVSRASGMPVRRPWCLSCCQHLDPGRYHLIPFQGHRGAGRSL